jgi:hypothetical protein
MEHSSGQVIHAAAVLIPLRCTAITQIQGFSPGYPNPGKMKYHLKENTIEITLKNHANHDQKMFRKQQEFE